jgi:hypothetical protein
MYITICILLLHTQNVILCGNRYSIRKTGVTAIYLMQNVRMSLDAECARHLMQNVRMSLDANMDKQSGW